MILLVALKLEPANVGILWDCAALCYQMDNSKKALEYYEKACQVTPLRSDTVIFQESFRMILERSFW